MQLAILAIGRNKEILDIVVRLLNARPEWHAAGAVTNEQALTLFDMCVFDLVLLCGGIEDEEEAFLREAFLQKNPALMIVQHYGGGSGLLENEVRAATER